MACRPVPLCLATFKQFKVFGTIFGDSGIFEQLFTKSRFRAHIKYEKVNYFIKDSIYANLLNDYRPFEHITCQLTTSRSVRRHMVHVFCSVTINESLIFAHN